MRRAFVGVNLIATDTQVSREFSKKICGAQERGIAPYTDTAPGCPCTPLPGGGA
jgi:hypothetical protein